MRGRFAAGVVSFCVMFGALANRAILADDEKVDVLDAKVVSTMTSPAESFQRIVVSPDGKLVATTSGVFSKSVEIWDATTGKLLGSLPNARDPVGCVAFTPDNKSIITGDGVGFVGVWDGATRKLRKKFKATLDAAKDTGTRISAIAVSPDGKIVYVGEDDHVPGIWDVAKGKRMVKDRETKGSPLALSLAPKSQLFVSAASGLRLWDAKTGKDRKAISFEGGRARAIRFSPDEKSIAVGHDLGLFLVDIASEKLTIFDDINGYPAVAFSKDGKTLVAFKHADISAWDLQSGKKKSAIEIKRDTANSIGAVSADGSVFAIPFSGTKLEVYGVVVP